MIDAVRRLSPAALLLAACATSRPAPPPPPQAPAARPSAMLPRSSIAAVIAHRSELRLDDGQLGRLQKLDDDLQRQRDRLGAPAPRPTPAGAAGAAASPGAASPADDARPVGRGGARGGRHGRREKGADAPAPADRESAWNDADTAAYLRAEAILRPDQRDAAREIAEGYREALYDVRAAERPGVSGR
jgi:hypothetical protein